MEGSSLTLRDKRNCSRDPLCQNVALQYRGNDGSHTNTSKAQTNFLEVSQTLGAEFGRIQTKEDNRIASTIGVVCFTSG